MVKNKDIQGFFWEKDKIFWPFRAGIQMIRIFVESEDD